VSEVLVSCATVLESLDAQDRPATITRQHRIVMTRSPADSADFAIALGFDATASGTQRLAQIETPRPR
jgi:hypothetical protein